MPLLYRALRRVLKLGLELYYVDIRALGADRVPAKGPVIFAANHPNSIMDTVVLGSQTDRTISYMARSGLFANPLVALLFENAGVIPIFRRQDGAGDTAGNDAAFAAAYDVLKNGGTIGIFPEGQNAPERHVRDIRTGTARIALGAEAANGWSLGVSIVPVGLNFEDRDKALTRVLVRFGEPIRVSDLRSAYEADERETVRTLTNRIQDGIRSEAVHIEDVRNTELVEAVASIYGATLIEEVLGKTPDVRGIDEKLLERIKGGLSKKTDLDDWFTAKQRIAAAVSWFAREKPEELERMRGRIRSYEEHLAQASLRRDFLDRPPKTLSARKEAVKMSLYAVLLAPIALFGLIHNFVPARITRRAMLAAPDEAMRAIRALVVGAIAYGLTYAFFGAIAWGGTESPWWTALYVATLPFAGMWWVRYRRQLARYGSRLVVRTLFRRRSRLLRALALEREQIFTQLDLLRQEYQARPGA